MNSCRRDGEYCTHCSSSAASISSVAAAACCVVVALSSICLVRVSTEGCLARLACCGYTASWQRKETEQAGPCGAARRTVALDGWPCPGHGLHQRLRVMYVAEQDGPEFVFVLSVNLNAPPACLSAGGRPLRLAHPPFWCRGLVANRPNGSEIVGRWTED
eukprot:COSAG06_NODE_4863_length_3896_cov_2.568870_2_plen_160_part_00